MFSEAQSRMMLVTYGGLCRIKLSHNIYLSSSYGAGLFSIDIINSSMKYPNTRLSRLSCITQIYLLGLSALPISPAGSVGSPGLIARVTFNLDSDLV